MIISVCCGVCARWNFCSAKWYRGERDEPQICCPLCDRFSQCNRTFPRYNDPSFLENLINVINHSISKERFVTAHHFAIFLPNKDFATLKKVRAIYVNTFDKKKNRQILHEGSLLFENLCYHVERKADAEINLAYFKEYLNPCDADKAILEALKHETSLNSVVEFFIWLKKKEGTGHLTRLSAIAQRTGNATFRGLCSNIEQINLQFESMKNANKVGLRLVDKLETFIHKFRDSLDTKNLGILISSVLGEAIKSLEQSGDAYRKSGKNTDALEYYEGAITGLKLFTELRPYQPDNFASVVCVLEKVQKLRIVDEQEVKEQIKIFSEKMIELTFPPSQFYSYSACTKIANVFWIYGQLLEKEKGIDEAKTYFAKSVEYSREASRKFKPRNPKSEKTRRQCDALLTAKCLIKLQRYDEAEKCCQDILDKYPDWYEGYLYKGKALMERECYDESEACFEKCRKMDPKGPGSYDNIAILYEKKGEYNNAIKTCVALMKLSAVKRNKKGLHWAFFRLARLWEDKGCNRVPINLFKYIILKRQPEHLEAHGRLATLYMRHLDWESAVGVLENKIKIKDNNDLYFDLCRLGDCYKNLNREDEAIRCYKSAEEMVPSGLPALSQLGKFFEEQDNVDEAIAYVTKIINVLGDQKEAADDYVWRGDLYQKQDKIDLANYDYRHGLEINPDLYKAYPRLCNVSTADDAKDLQSQLADLERYLEEIPPDQPEYKQISLSLVQKYIQSENPANAEKALHHLENTAYSPESPEYLERRATISEELKNNLQEAIYWRSKVLDLPLLSKDKRLQKIVILLEWYLKIDAPEAKYVPLLERLEKVQSIRLLEEQDSAVFRKSESEYQSIAQYFLRKRKNYRMALKFADLLLEKIKPHDKVYLTIKGRALIGLRKYNEADLVFSYLLSNYPEDSIAIYYKGEIQRRHGALGDAIGYFQQSYSLCKDSGDQQGLISALNRMVKIYAQKNDHSRVIEAATEVLGIDPDDAVIRLSRALSYIAFGQKEKGFKDFISIFKSRPSDAIAARKLIGCLPLEKGDNNNPEIISELLSLTPNVRFKQNILERLTELSIFPRNPVELVGPILRDDVSNYLIRPSVAHYLCRYSIYLYFFRQSQLEENLRNIIELFKSCSDTNVWYFGEFFKEFVGSERGAYLEFYADTHENEFIDIDKMLNKLNLRKLQAEDAERAASRIDKFLQNIKRPYDFLMQGESQVDLKAKLQKKIAYLKNHGSDIWFSLPDKKMDVDEGRAGLLTEAFKDIAYELNNVMPYKNLAIDYHKGEKDISLELKGPCIKVTQELSAVLGDIQSRNLRCSLRDDTSGFIVNVSVMVQDEQAIPETLHDLLKYQLKTYKEFLFTRKEPNYWNNVGSFIQKLDFNDQGLVNSLIRYCWLQINKLAGQCRTDFKSSVAPYHRIKNIIRLLTPKRGLSLEEQIEITDLQWKVQRFLRSSRFPKFANVSMLEIAEKVSQTFKDNEMVRVLRHIDVDDEIYADAMRLQDCVENLVFNACNAVKKKGASEHSVKDSVTVRFAKENGAYAVVCKDTGCGMSEEEVERFEKGLTGRTGTMCILKTVDIHGGNLEIKSRPEQGTEMKILIKGEMREG